jgi:hypothetical protein
MLSITIPSEITKGRVTFQRVTEARRDNPLQCRERLGGVLRYYHQNAA